ncbi:PHR domain [Popillia japonica]|uniref:PHR domain n=1 Tax=Popillia japonica TaxID=7064 RepID=A0AAW1JIU8_POPJA
MMRLDLIFRDKMKDLVTPKQRAKLQEQLQTRFEERKTRRKGIVGTSKQVVKGKSPRSSLVSSPIHRSNNVLKQANILAKEQTGSDVERDTTKIACLPPAKIQLVCDSPVIQIACGLHHTVLLLQNGQVYSFGSNQYGQLGCGDILAKANIQLVKLPCSAVHIAAGSNHTVVLTSKGEVYTFGNYQKGQLGRVPPITSPQDVAQPGQSNSTRYQNPRCPWYSIPGPITNIGPRHGRRATWVGASGDQTFIKIDESLINTVSLAKSTVTANRSHLLLIPNLLENANTFKSLVINKRDGTCSFFKGKEQVDFYNKCVYLDPIYNTLWSYNPTNFEISLHNIVACDLVHKSNIETTDGKYLVDIKIVNKKHKDEINLNGFNLSSILTPELALPVMSNCQVTRLQAAINLLCCLDTLSVAHDLHLSAIKEEVEDRQMVSGKRYCRDDFQCVNRFESHGGGWGYSGHSVEAVRFMADIDILLGGFGLFGGRGEYTAKVKLWDIGPEGGEQEGDGELLAETEEVPYECGPRQKFAILFDEPIALQAQRWYVAWAQINGPSSDCGSAGQAMVTTEDQVLFYFKSSKKSNNGTDVNAGQIPQLLYKVITMEHQAPVRPIDQSEPVQVLSKEFSRSVSKECFQSLLSLLQWSWNTFKVGISDGQSLQHMYTALELERLVYVSRASLRLLRTFTNEIYPNHITRKNPLENVHLAGSVGDVRSLLKQMLSDNLPLLMQSKKSTRPKPKCELYVKMLNGILDECHNTFVACFHAFYPTTYLKWTCLCDLLTDIDSESKSHSSSNSQRLLSAVLCALCGPTVRLRSTFPLLGGNISSDSSLHKGLSPSDNTGLPMMSGSDTHHYPILVEQMSYRSQMESVCSGSTWSWKEVLDRLLKLITEPVSKQLLGHKITPLPGLTKNCCHLLARVIAELVHQCSGNDEDLHAGCGRILHMTPPRFTRVNNSRTWNTGNGSPDAIAFQVDRPGISIAGAGVYGGLGHFEYELELLEDQSTAGGSDQSHTQRWNSLEATRGSFGPEDYPPEIVEIKFDKPVSIKENTKYALRLRNHGGRTNNGDTGVNALKGSDNTTFTFTTCSLSFNGTTVARGQIPVILYYSNPAECARISSNKLEQYARKGALSMTTSIIQNSSHLLILAREKADEIPCGDILNNACIIKTLLPLVMAHISSLATSDPRCAVQILNLIQEILPHVAALNLLMGGSGTNCNISQTECFDGSTNTTSLHYTWVQSEHPYKPATSEHPYKPATVSNYRVLFPDSVKWISIEFDTTCATVQPEDSLQLYVPCLGDASGKSAKVADSDEELPPMPYWPVLHRFSSCMQWPQASIVLPGHEVVFSLETASDYLKDDRASSYGFRCMVVGYEWPPAGGAYSSLGLKHLEAELAFLGGMCAASMIKKDLQLPPVGGEEVEDEDVEVAEFVAAQTLAAHGQLLSKGLALSSPPTVTQALDGTLPYR